jgi:hypothetical protein
MPRASPSGSKIKISKQHFWSPMLSRLLSWWLQREQMFAPKQSYHTSALCTHGVLVAVIVTPPPLIPRCFPSGCEMTLLLILWWSVLDDKIVYGVYFVELLFVFVANTHVCLAQLQSRRYTCTQSYLGKRSHRLESAHDRNGCRCQRWCGDDVSTALSSYFNWL